MISMRIGRQGIPLCFCCFKGKDNSNAFDENLLKEGIFYVSSLFSSNYDLIFLADRWFNSTSLLEHINSLGHTYVIRFKDNIRCSIYDKKEKHNIWKNLKDIKALKYHSSSYMDVPITDKYYKVNIESLKELVLNSLGLSSSMVILKELLKTMVIDLVP